MSQQDAILVLGLGSSGEAAARLLLSEGKHVTVVDGMRNTGLESRASALRSEGACVELGVESLPAEAFGLAVVSPGIPRASDWLTDLSSRGVPFVSELELGWSRCRGRVLAVTGSNGKSTCVKLCHEALLQSGRRAAMAGNYGPPLSGVVRAQPDCDWYVVEVSSFQLETVADFRPDVGVLLNILPNHLDRHGDMATYTALKLRLFSRMTPADTGVVSEDCAGLAMRDSGAKCRWVPFGHNRESPFHYRDHELIASDGVRLGLAGTPFDNPILGPAAAAAAAALAACGAEPNSVAEAAREFEALPHRMRCVGAQGGVSFVDDSKATNVAALDAALSMSQGPVRLIAGGRLKERNVDVPKKRLATKVSGAYLIGEAMATLASAWEDVVPCYQCGTLHAAVRAAWLESNPGDTILLSPACTSFDQFTSFEERGDAFIKCVHRLAKEV